MSQCWWIPVCKYPVFLICKQNLFSPLKISFLCLSWEHQRLESEFISSHDTFCLRWQLVIFCSTGSPEKETKVSFNWMCVFLWSIWVIIYFLKSYVGPCLVWLHPLLLHLWSVHFLPPTPTSFPGYKLCWSWHPYFSKSPGVPSPPEPQWPSWAPRFVDGKTINRTLVCTLFRTFIRALDRAQQSLQLLRKPGRQPLWSSPVSHRPPGC